MTVLKVGKADKDGNQLVSYPIDHPKVKKIEKWLDNGLSAGYIEWLLTHDDDMASDPHCCNCRAMDCDNVGMGDDACRGFQYGEKW